MTQKKQKTKAGSSKEPPDGTPKDKKPSNNWAIILAILTAVASLVAILNGIFDFGNNVKEVRATLTLAPSATLTFTPIPTNTPLFTPGPLTFIELPKEVRAGNDIKVVVQAWEGAYCFLEFFTKDDNKSVANGLGSTSPNSLGRCTWTWHVNSNTHEGTGKLIVQVGEFVEEHPLEILPEN